MEPRAGRRRLTPLLAVLLLLSGCTYDSREPGLFGRPNASSSATQPPDRGGEETPSVNPDLPVVGDAVWTSGEGQHIRIRIAVHAARRIPGATVLDWSVTPLRAPGLDPGDPLPAALDLGLMRPGGDNVNIYLVDSSAERVYRPLSGVSDGVEHCLCSLPRVAEQELVLGQTRLLQVAFPPLPAGLRTIDVDITTVPLFWRVPVTEVGLVPSASGPTDLADRGEIPLPGPPTRFFPYGPSGQRFYLSVDEVLTSSTFTSLRWTIHTLTPGPGLDSAATPPLVESGGLRQLVPAAASGPQLVPAGSTGRRLRARLMSVRGAAPATEECLCTDLRRWTASLKDEEQQASVVTNLPALPGGTRRVDVVFPGLPAVRGVEVTRASDGTSRSVDSMPRPSESWTYRPESPSGGWPVDQWPTPLPAPDQLEQYQATVETLVR